MPYTKGQRLQLTDHVGYRPDFNPGDPMEQFLDRHHPLFKGQVGVVDDVTPAGVYPAPEGGKSQEHVTLQFEPRQFVDHGNPDDGPTHVAHPNHVAYRRVSFSADQMAALFTEAPE